MNRLLVFTLFILFTGWGRIHAQTRVSGTVKDPKGHAIRGASVTVKDSYDGATADSLADFHFQSAEKGTFTLVISNIGYNTVEQPITFAGSPIELHIMLK